MPRKMRTIPSADVMEYCIMYTRTQRTTSPEGKTVFKVFERTFNEYAEVVNKAINMAVVMITAASKVVGIPRDNGDEKLTLWSACIYKRDSAKGLGDLAYVVSYCYDTKTAVVKGFVKR